MEVERITVILLDCLGNVDGDQRPLQGTEKVDVWETVLLIPDRVQKYELEMIELLRDWPSEHEGQSVPPLGYETTCADVEDVLGNQLYGYLLFAFGKRLGWWDIFDPRSVLHLGKANRFAQLLANAGMIAVTGYKPGGVKPVSQR